MPISRARAYVHASATALVAVQQAFAQIYSTLATAERVFEAHGQRVDATREAALEAAFNAEAEALEDLIDVIEETGFPDLMEVLQNVRELLQEDAEKALRRFKKNVAEVEAEINSLV